MCGVGVGCGVVVCVWCGKNMKQHTNSGVRLISGCTCTSYGKKPQHIIWGHSLHSIISLSLAPALRRRGTF